MEWPNGNTQYLEAFARHVLPLEEVTIAEALAEAGYVTGYYGKGHIGQNANFQPDKQGFRHADTLPRAVERDGSPTVEGSTGDVKQVGALTAAAVRFIPLFGMGFVFADADLALIVVSLNAAALLLYEMLAKRIAWLSGRWMPRLVMLAVLATLIVPVLRAIFQDSIFDDTPETRSIRLAPVVWMGLSAIGVWAYLNWRRDLFMLAALALEAIIIASAFLGKQLHCNDAGGMLLLSLLVALMTGAAAWWLRQTARRWEGESWAPDPCRRCLKR